MNKKTVIILTCMLPFLLAGTYTTDDLITKTSPLIDIRAYLPSGYVVDGSVDYATEIQAAFNAAGPGETVFIPSGVWRIESTIDVDGATNIRGSGYNSRISAVGCNAFNVSISAELASTEWYNFHIIGDGSASYNGIVCAGTAVSGAYTAGATYNNLYIRDFHTGIYWRSVCFSRIVNCNINHVWYGIFIKGQCVQNVIDNTIITLDFFTEGAIAGVGDSIGIYIDSASDYDPGGTTEHYPEDLVITNTGVAGFDYGILLVKCLYTVIDSCDLDRMTKYGIVFSNKWGGLTVKDCWIALTGSDALYGIYGGVIAGAEDITAVLAHNRITAVNSPHANSVGICIYDHQNNVTSRDNSIDGFQLHDIKYHGNKGGVIENNHCASTDPTNSIIVTNPTGVTKASNNDIAGGFSVAIPIITDGDATPSVKRLTALRSLGTTTITDFDDGIEGQTFTFLAETSITTTDGTNMFLYGSANFDMTATDTLTLICKADEKWYEVSRSDRAIISGATMIYEDSNTMVFEDGNTMVYD